MPIRVSYRIFVGGERIDNVKHAARLEVYSAKVLILGSLRLLLVASGTLECL